MKKKFLDALAEGDIVLLEATWNKCRQFGEQEKLAKQQLLNCRAYDNNNPSILYSTYYWAATHRNYFFMQWILEKANEVGFNQQQIQAIADHNQCNKYIFERNALELVKWYWQMREKLNLDQTLFVNYGFAAACKFDNYEIVNFIFEKFPLTKLEKQLTAFNIAFTTTHNAKIVDLLFSKVKTMCSDAEKLQTFIQIMVTNFDSTKCHKNIASWLLKTAKEFMIEAPKALVEVAKTEPAELGSTQEVSQLASSNKKRKAEKAEEPSGFVAKLPKAERLAPRTDNSFEDDSWIEKFFAAKAPSLGR
jgi:hypothetical protein